MKAADSPPAFEWQQSAADAGTLVVAGLKVALSAKRTHGSSGDMASFYSLRFHIVDEDKNNYLDRKEFAALGLPGADFAAVDANGDGQIVEAGTVRLSQQKGERLFEPGRPRHRRRKPVALRISRHAARRATRARAN